MNINQYKSAMDEIVVEKIDINELLRKKSMKEKRMKYINIIPTIILIFILIININPFHYFSDINSGIIVKAYAAGDEIQLTNDFISFKLEANQIDGGTDSSHYFINYNLNLRCEGEGISTVTYICSDQFIDRNNRLSSSAYYVENIFVPVSDYTNYTNNDDFIYGYIAEGQNIAKITKLIGSSYTVNYDNQNNKQYGLVLAGILNKNGIYQFNDIIKMDITLKDGSILHKKIVISSTNKNSYSEILMRIK